MPVMLWDKGTTVESGNPHLTIVNIHEDKPQWGRRYVIRLDDRATLTISTYSFLGGRQVDGELRQPNGKSVSFRPEEIADKIIDRTLVPLVQTACDEILALDRAYMKSNRREFVDEDGTLWQAA
jgi:hypothetical protein